MHRKYGIFIYNLIMYKYMKYNFYLLKSNKSIVDIRYIGVTTKTLECRYYQHKHEAKRKADRPVYHWWNKRITENFQITIEPLEIDFTGDWEEREKYWIRHYRQMGFNLLNVSEGGVGIITNEQRTKSSRQRSIEAHNKSVIALTKDGKFYKEYSSCREAAKEFHTVPTAITNACKSRWSKSSHGYMWIFKSDYDPNKNYQYQAYENWPKCYKFDIFGNLLKTYSSVNNCAKTEHIDTRKLNKLIKNKLIENNFIFSSNLNINIIEYKDNKIYKVFEYDSNNILVNKYETLKEFFQISGFSIHQYYKLSDKKNFSFKNDHIIHIL